MRYYFRDNLIFQAKKKWISSTIRYSLLCLYQTIKNSTTINIRYENVIHPHPNAITDQTRLPNSGYENRCRSARSGLPSSGGRRGAGDGCWGAAGAGAAGAPLQRRGQSATGGRALRLFDPAQSRITSRRPRPGSALAGRTPRLRPAPRAMWPRGRGARALDVAPIMRLHDEYEVRPPRGRVRFPFGACFSFLKGGWFCRCLRHSWCKYGGWVGVGDLRWKGSGVLRKIFGF